MKIICKLVLICIFFGLTTLEFSVAQSALTFEERLERANAYRREQERVQEQARLRRANAEARRLRRSLNLVNSSFDFLSALGSGRSVSCMYDLRNSGGMLTPDETLCLETYEDFYADSDGDGKVNIDVYMGYGDMNSHQDVVDPINRVALVSAFLRSPCPENVHVCGFTATDDAEVFTKIVRTPSGEERIVQLRLRSSAVGTNNAENISTPAQAARSELVRQQFTESLRESEAVIYYGHSRYGGGPDFYPPLLNRNDRIRSDVYRRRRTGLNDITNNINRPPNRLKFLGLMSCDSDEHFTRAIRRRRPSLGLSTTSDAATDSTMIPGILGNIDSLLGQKCEQEFSESLNPSSPVADTDAEDESEEESGAGEEDGPVIRNSGFFSTGS